MKGIVVDRQGAYAAVLDDRGAVRRIRDRHYAIGQQVSLSPHLTRRGVAALAAALTLLLSLGTVAYATPAGTVSLDSAGAVEYTINCFDRVLSVQAVDEAGAATLRQIGEESLRHRKVSDAVSATVETLQQSGRVAPEGVLISASGGETHAEKLCHQLRSAVETQNGVPAAAVAVTPAQVEEAHAHGVTAARQWARDNAPNSPMANDFTQGNFAQNDFGQTDMGQNGFGANPPVANDFGASAPGGNAAPGTPPVLPQP